MRDRVQYHAKYENEDGEVCYTNIIWGMSVKPNLADNEMEVVIVATGFNTDDFSRPRRIKNGEDEDVVIVRTTPTIEETPGGAKKEEVNVPPMPKYRPAPAPITRPSHNFAVIEECKRVPAYITHKVNLTTPVAKTHQVAGVESDEETKTESVEIPSLF